MEDREAPVVSPAYHPRIDAETRKAIQLGHLVDGLSQYKLADRFKVDRATVRRALRGDDYDELQKQIVGEQKAEVLNTLRTHASSATAHWVKTFPKASKRGNHKPMEDFLKAAGMIEQADGPRILVQVGVKLTGRPE